MAHDTQESTQYLSTEAIDSIRAGKWKWSVALELIMVVRIVQAVIGVVMVKTPTSDQDRLKD
jgi:heme A synthase